MSIGEIVFTQTRILQFLLLSKVRFAPGSHRNLFSTTGINGNSSACQVGV